jgi:hypothetical protein
MLVLLGFGIVVALVRDPALLGELSALSFRFRLPELALTQIGWQDVVTGVLVLGLPQAALTLGNAIVAAVEENTVRALSSATRPELERAPADGSSSRGLARRGRSDEVVTVNGGDRDMKTVLTRTARARRSTSARSAT